MPSEDWAPAVADVGALLRARTKDVNGQEQGTFNDDTRPTGDEVEALLAEAVGDTSTLIGTDTVLNPLGQRFWGSAKMLTVLATAMAIELSYFPEQVATGRSPYEQLKALYDERLGRLTAGLIASGDDTGVAGAIEDPVYSFPTDVPIIGWRRGAF